MARCLAFKAWSISAVLFGTVIAFLLPSPVIQQFRDLREAKRTPSGCSESDAGLVRVVCSSDSG